MVFESLDRDRGFRFGCQNKTKTKKIKILWFRKLHQRISPNECLDVPYISQLAVQTLNPL